MAGDTGLQILYDPEEAGRGSPVAEWVIVIVSIYLTDQLHSIVFEHGLGGHRLRTWTRKRAPDPSNTQSLIGRLLSSQKRKATTLDNESNSQTSNQVKTGGIDVFWPKDLLPKDLQTTAYVLVATMLI